MNRRNRQLVLAALGIVVILIAVFVIRAITSREAKMSVSVRGGRADSSSGYYYTLCAGDQFYDHFSCTTSEHYDEEDCILTIEKVTKDYVTVNSYGSTNDLTYGETMRLFPEYMMYDNSDNTYYIIQFSPIK